MEPQNHIWGRGIASADMFFDNVEVPVENIIVPAGGFKKLMEAFDLERCGFTMSLAAVSPPLIMRLTMCKSANNSANQ